MLTHGKHPIFFFKQARLSGRIMPCIFEYRLYYGQLMNKISRPEKLLYDASVLCRHRRIFYHYRRFSTDYARTPPDRLYTSGEAHIRALFLGEKYSIAFGVHNFLLCIAPDLFKAQF